MARDPRNLAQDGMDFSPLPSLDSLFERWCVTWDADTDPQKRKALAWKREAIVALVDLHSPRGTSDEQKADMVTTLTANTSADSQEWFSGMLVNPRGAFTRATEAILAGSYYSAMSEYLQGALGDGRLNQPHLIP
jgi:hypothetical protein